ncbi:hypothetical protein ACH5RR_025773 [Cinchona calisaya]|uniref:TF-B3 domain-containing protein n=1 Tax=Cinchona calisaya TaxID=153742 RepID=A0ABD2Z2J3_9GENT
MEKNGKVCYTHDSPEFFKVYLDQLCSTNLRIPPDFVRKFNGDVPRKFTLEGPGGRSWHIVARKVDGYFFFQEGWAKFVQDNSLEDGDFLTFCYGGCSKFYVKIYGKHGCRKEVALTASWNEKATEHQLHGKSNDNLPTRRTLRPRTLRRGSKISHAVKAQDKMRYKSAPFTVRLTKTYAAKCLSFPMPFCKRYIEEKWKNRPKAILRSGDKQWEMSIIKSGCKYQLYKGWASFVKENSLQKGDECTFQLIDNKDDIVLKVTTLKSPAKKR